VLLKAFSSFENKNIRLMIFGSGQEDFVDNLKEIVRNDNRVSFCGQFSEEQLGDIFNQIDVLVTPSICYESYSLVLHEALACNVPVIASNLGGMAEAIRDGFNGFIFEPGSLEDLKKKMDIIIDNASILNEIKENITMNIVVPTVEQEAYNYFQIYNNLLQMRYCNSGLAGNII
jgi:glycosyltransferase involved in cell wall biosynthesis